MYICSRPHLGTYVTHAGRVNSLLMVLCTALYSLCITFPNYWLKLWVESGPGKSWHFVLGYILLSIMAWTTTCCGVWYVVVQTPVPFRGAPSLIFY